MHDVSDLIVCSSCKEVPVNVMESKCCHSLMCWDCVIAKAAQPCPSCTERLNPEDFVENAALNKILETAQIRCRFQGCRQQVRAVDRRNHEETCRFASVLCPNSDTCGIFQKEDLVFHSCPHRRVQCHLCEVTLPLSSLESHLEEECPEAVVACSQGCSATVVRKDLILHQASDCPQTLVACPLDPMCSQVIRRCEVNAHLQHSSAEHIGLIQQRLMAQESEIQSLRATVAELSERRFDPMSMFKPETQRSAARCFHHFLSFALLLRCMLIGFACEVRQRIRSRRNVHPCVERSCSWPRIRFMQGDRLWFMTLFFLFTTLLPKWIWYLWGFGFMMLSTVGVCRSTPARWMLIFLNFLLYIFIYNKLKILLIAMVILKVISRFR